MWRNYLTVAIRALAKSRTYSIINIAGLAIGMAACLMILLFIRYETSYDRWVPDAPQVFQFQAYYQSKGSADKFDNQGSAYVTKAALLKDFPEIERAVYMGDSPTLIKDGEAIGIEDGRMVDGSFLEVVPLPMLSGDARALSRPGTMVLTAREAMTLYGTANVIGRTATLLVAGKKGDYRITGVLQDLPKNSHLAIKMLARADFASLYSDTPDLLTQWGWTAGWVYLKLRPDADVAALNTRLDAWKKRNIPDEVFNGQRQNPGDERTYAFVNVADVHLGKAQSSSMTPGNDTGTIATFAIIALLILGMAIINFTNLATARAGVRAREVALRKVLGASRRQLIAQFLAESMLIASVAMLLALAICELALPPFSAFLDADLHITYFGTDGIAAPVVALVLIVGLASGLYPAFYLSRFAPAVVLKANKSAADAAGSGRLRSALVVAQFAVSIGLIICTAVVYAQTVYARSVDPGYRRAGILQLSGIGAPELRHVADTLTRRIEALPGVESVGRTGLGVNTGSTSTTGVMMPGNPKTIDIGTYPIDTGFFRTMGIRLVAGRTFDVNRARDDQTTPFPVDDAAERALVARGANVVLNELGVERLGFGSPQQAIGKTFKVGADDKYGGTMVVTVIGVVTNSRFRSVRIPVEPIMFRYDRSATDWLVARYAGDPRAIRARVQAVWRDLAPDVPFDARFSEDIIVKLYRTLDARAQIFAGFSGLAVVIGCLGLFGLAAFTAERRTKEIGIRKVLGARTRDIVRLLVWQFSRPVVIANIIAWPVAWWLMRDWLNTFDDRITLGPVPFIGAAAIALVIAMGTVAGHAIRIARANPIHALRYE